MNHDFLNILKFLTKFPYFCFTLCSTKLHLSLLVRFMQIILKLSCIFDDAEKEGKKVISLMEEKKKESECIFLDYFYT